ncbi:uncharacterized protein AB675_3520 [Cyphellophora attinorum]|uniref:Uncharacterized protein n=1 Tax=Cyphellophora attinorum TaxID=1664694 RepID=A0A0N1NZ10_9EURO|nr:uncharacterized protein AB675_3520 [Phialophora attinorum]KPI39783.1 hypothetical protein AB675_3520 [Phialophora attinorum]
MAESHRVTGFLCLPCGVKTIASPYRDLLAARFPNVISAFEEISPEERKVGTARKVRMCNGVDVIFLFLPELSQSEKCRPDFKDVLGEYTRAWRDCIRDLKAKAHDMVSSHTEPTQQDYDDMLRKFYFALPVWAEPTLWDDRSSTGKLCDVAELEAIAWNDFRSDEYEDIHDYHESTQRQSRTAQVERMKLKRLYSDTNTATDTVVYTRLQNAITALEQNIHASSDLVKALGSLKSEIQEAGDCVRHQVREMECVARRRTRLECSVKDSKTAMAKLVEATDTDHNTVKQLHDRLAATAEQRQMIFHCFPSSETLGPDQKAIATQGTWLLEVFKSVDCPKSGSAAILHMIEDDRNHLVFMCLPEVLTAERDTRLGYMGAGYVNDWITCLLDIERELAGWSLTDTNLIFRLYLPPTHNAAQTDYLLQVATGLLRPHTVVTDCEYRKWQSISSESGAEAPQVAAGVSGPGITQNTSQAQDSDKSDMVNAQVEALQQELERVKAARTRPEIIDAAQRLHAKLESAIKAAKKNDSITDNVTSALEDLIDGLLRSSDIVPELVGKMIKAEQELERRFQRSQRKMTKLVKSMGPDGSVVHELVKAHFEQPFLEMLQMHKDQEVSSQ